MLAANKLEPSTSACSATPILVPKKDKSWQIVFNYQPINCQILPLAWPLEAADKVLQKLPRFQWNCAFDFSLSYHQVPIAKFS